MKCVILLQNTYDLKWFMVIIYGQSKNLLEVIIVYIIKHREE